MSEDNRSLVLWSPDKPRGNWKWGYGTRLRKKAGSSWQGRVVGFYQTHLTPEGYAIESEREPGSVQIYPAAALEEVQT
jgi:dihydrofolate reductase (trimethoprim resistance protein)